MKIGTLVVVLGVFAGAATAARAQVATADPLADLQNDFGVIVGDAFRRPDPIVAATSQSGSPATEAGFALRTSLEVPGAVFAGIMQPFAEADKGNAPVPTPGPKHLRHARIRHRAAVQG